jgi:adenylylsulfate reductase, subunit B
MPPIINDKTCIKCGACVDICPVDVYYNSLENEIPAISYGEDCYYCSACILECPADAIELRYPLYAQPSYAADK